MATVRAFLAQSHRLKWSKGTHRSTNYASVPFDHFIRDLVQKFSEILSIILNTILLGVAYKNKSLGPGFNNSSQTDWCIDQYNTWTKSYIAFR